MSPEAVQVAIHFSTTGARYLLPCEVLAYDMVHPVVNVAGNMVTLKAYPRLRAFELGHLLQDFSSVLARNSLGNGHKAAVASDLARILRIKDQFYVLVRHPGY